MSVDRNTLCGFAAVLLWSTTIAFARSISEQIGPVTAASAVYLTGGAGCLVYLILSRGGFRQIRNLSFKYLLVCGALFVSYMVAIYLAVGLAAGRRQVTEVGLLNYLWPSLTILFSLVILKKKGGLLLIPGTLSALIGVFLVLTQSSSVSWASFSANLTGNPAAYSLALFAAVSWALYSNLARRWAGRTDGSGVAVFIPVTGLILLLLRMMNPEQGVWTTHTVLEVLFLGLATTLGYVLWDIGIRKGDVVLVAAFSYLTPFLSTVVTCLYLKVAAGTGLWVGCALIVLGSLLSRRSISDRDEEETLNLMNDSRKQQLYDEVLDRIGSMLEGEKDISVVMAAAVSELHKSFDHFDWTGFYIVAEPDLLKLGPYEGPEACLEISFDRGVCGKAARTKETQIVPDVREISDYITCSASTRSEIVAPVMDSNGKLAAVLDIDSDTIDAFDKIDRKNIEKLCLAIGSLLHPLS